MNKTNEGQKVLPVFIGYDEREHIPYVVARYSTYKSTASAKVLPLNHRELRSLGYFDRPWRIAENGQYIDERDGRPFSTQFSHTRFLTPYVAAKKFPNAKYAIFFDCDFVVLEDLELAVAEAVAINPNFSVAVTKHDFTPKTETKMDGVVQTAYPKKLWSAFMIFNLEHPDCQKLTPEVVNTQPGSFFHQFQWTSEDDIVGIDLSWQHVVGHSPEEAKAATVHWTSGGPWFVDYKDCPRAEVWNRRVYRAMADFDSLPDMLCASFMDA